MILTTQKSPIADQLWTLVKQQNALEAFPDIYEKLEEVGFEQMEVLLNYWHPLAIEEKEVTERTQLIHAVDYVIHLLSIKILEKMGLGMLSLVNMGQPALAQQFRNLCEFKYLLTVPHNLSTNPQFKELYDQAYEVERTVTPDLLKQIYSISWSRVQNLLSKTVNLTVPELIATMLPTPHPTFQSISWEVICKTLLKDNSEKQIAGIAFPPFRIGEEQLAYMKESLQGKTVEAIYLEVNQFDFTGRGLKILKKISLDQQVKKWDIRGMPTQFVASMKTFCHENQIECQIVSS